ncbi:MAG: DUF6798 domain-containing protein [Rubricoccaceae bacterium]
MTSSDTPNPGYPVRDIAAMLPVAALGAASALLAHGYRYGDGDHDDVLPLVLHALDPSLYPHDAHVQHAGGGALRAAFVKVVAAGARLLGLEAAVGVLHLLTLGAVAVGVYALARAIVRSRPAGLGAALLACGPLAHWTLGGNALAYAHLVPESLAWPFLLFALCFWLRGRTGPAAALAGAGAWFHPLAGMLLALTMSIAELLGPLLRPLTSRPVSGTAWRRHAARSLAMGAVFLLVASPVLAPVLLAQRAESLARLPFGLSGFEAYSQIRFPHHHLPTAFSAGSWLRTGLLLAAGLAAGAWSYRKRPGAPLRRAALLAGTAVCLCALIGGGTVAFSSLTLARVQVFRLTVVLNVLACALVANLVANLVADAARRAVLPARIPKRPPRAAPRLTLALVSGSVIGGLALAAWMLGRSPAPGALAEVERWASLHLPPDALVAVPPGNTTFRVRARRSVVATWKAVPFRLDALGSWLRDLDALAPGVLSPGLLPQSPVPRGVTGLPERLDAAYAARQAGGWQRLGQATGATVALVPHPVPPDLVVLYAAGPDEDGAGWTLVSLAPPDEQP